MLEFKLLMTLLCKNIVSRCIVQTVFVFVVVPIGATALIHFVTEQHSQSPAWIYAQAVVLAMTPTQVAWRLAKVSNALLL